MLIYLLKASCCLALLLAFYKLFLENEKMHTSKRFYLLGSIVFSALVPAITFTTYVEVATSDLVINNTNWNETIVAKNGIQLLPFLSWVIYVLGFTFFGLRFFRNLYKTHRKINQNLHQYRNGAHFILLEENIIPHTFLKYIFVSKDDFNQDNIPEAVTLHEKIHILQKHSYDIIFVEIMCWFFWFNPILFLMKREIRLNHEFLADEAVINEGYSTSSYQKTLLKFGKSDQTPALSHSIHYQPLKKRFALMKKQKSVSKNLMKSLLVIPLLAFLITVFSTKAVAQIETETPIEKQELPALVKEYNKLAKKYKSQSDKTTIIVGKEISRLYELYELMSDKQKKIAEPFPNIPPPPPPAPPIVEEVKEIKRKPTTPKVIEVEGIERIQPTPPAPPAPPKKVVKGEKSGKATAASEKIKKGTSQSESASPVTSKTVVKGEIISSQHSLENMKNRTYKLPSIATGNALEAIGSTKIEYFIDGEKATTEEVNAFSSKNHGPIYLKVDNSNAEVFRIYMSKESSVSN